MAGGAAKAATRLGRNFPLTSLFLLTFLLSLENSAIDLSQAGYR